MFITSKVLHITQKKSKFIITNFLTGRCLSVERHIGELLYFCEVAKNEDEIVAFLDRKNVPPANIGATLDILIKKKILVYEANEEFIDTIPVRQTLWGCVPNINPNTQIVILGVPFGLGNSEDIRCKYFPKHFRNSIWGYFSYKGLKDNLDALNPVTVGSCFNFANFKKIIRGDYIADIGDVMYYSGETSDMFYSRLQEISKNIFRSMLIPVCIGGDHSIAYPVIAALNEIGNSFDILHFDAHADMNDGMVMKHHEQFGKKLVNHANVIKNIIEFSNVAHIYQIGVREPFLYNDNKVTRINVNDINKTKNDLIESSMPIYITFDVDYFDPSLAPGTASILPNGGDYDGTFMFLAEILTKKRILGMDIVEANPVLDMRNKTTFLVNNLLMHLISLINL